MTGRPLGMWAARRRSTLIQGLLNPDKRQKLDAICAHVAHLIDATTTHLTVVLEDCQIYAGEYQLPPLDALGSRPLPEAPELICTPLSHSMCKFVVEEHGPLLENDLAHSRFAEEQVVIAGELTAYVGVPVTAPDGIDIGSLCAFDQQTTRTWDENDVRTLSRFALLASAVLHT